MKKLLLPLLFLSFSIFGISINDVVFKRVFSGELKEEEELFVRSFLHAYRGIPSSVLKTDDPEGRLRFFFAEEPADLNDPTKEVYFVRAEHNNELIGFVSFERYGSADTAYIRELALDPLAMGYGLGRKLVFICQEYIPDINKIVLATTSYNKSAIGFYEHIGFTKCEDVPHGLDPSLFIGLEYSYKEEEESMIDIDSTVAAWQKFIREKCIDWKQLVADVEPIITGCGIVYELPNYLNRQGEGFAIVDMRHIAVAEPHYHPAGNTEIYFVLQGSAFVVVNKKEHNVSAGDVLIIEPEQAHFSISNDEFVLAIVNTPPYTPESYIPLYESTPSVGFDFDQFKELTREYQ